MNRILSNIRNLRRNHRVLLSVLTTVLVVILACSAVLAAVSFNYQGSATVVPSGGGGGGGGVSLSYDFTVNSDSIGTALPADFFALGDVLRGAQFTKTVYITKTGTASLVNVLVTKSDVSTGLEVTVPMTPIELTTGVATVPVDIVIAVSPEAPFDVPLTYRIAFTLAP